MDEDQRRAFDFVGALRTSYLDYHAKKEREAYVAAALYLGATVGVLTRSWTGPDRLLLLWGIAGATLVTVGLVFFQLYNRRFAARIVAACTTVTSRWLTTAPQAVDYSPTRRGPAEWPNAVAEAFDNYDPCRLRSLMIGLPALLLLWGAAVFIRVLACPN